MSNQSKQTQQKTSADLSNILEATLFASGKEVEIDFLMEKLQVTKAKFEKAVAVLQEKYSGECGINLLRFKNVEELYFIAVGANKKCVNTKLFARGSINMVGISMSDLMMYLASTKAHALIVVHNHPNGNCKPSAQDEKAFQTLKSMTSMANCQLLDSLIVGTDGLYSMENKMVARVYLDEVKPLDNLIFADKTQWMAELKSEIAGLND